MKVWRGNDGHLKGLIFTVSGNSPGSLCKWNFTWRFLAFLANNLSYITSCALPRNYVSRNYTPEIFSDCESSSPWNEPKLFFFTSRYSLLFTLTQIGNTVGFEMRGFFSSLFGCGAGRKLEVRTMSFFGVLKLDGKQIYKMKTASLGRVTVYERRHQPTQPNSQPPFDSNDFQTR